MKLQGNCIWPTAIKSQDHQSERCMRCTANCITHLRILCYKRTRSGDTFFILSSAEEKMKKFSSFFALCILFVCIAQIFGQEASEAPPSASTPTPLQTGLDRVRQSIAKLEELSQQFRDRIQHEAKHISQFIQSGSFSLANSTTEAASDLPPPSPMPSSTSPP